VAGFVVDTNCAQRGSLIGLRIDGGRTIANGASAGTARGVTVILQGRRVGGGRYTTFADTTRRVTVRVR
jgi:hypothetical protein